MNSLFNKIVTALFMIKRRIISLSAKNLADDVMIQYGLGKRFTHEYLATQFGVNFDMRYSDLHDLFRKTDPLTRTYIDYALSTNKRGLKYFNKIKPYLKKHHSRYIDIGSAYGGFIVAFAKAGYDSYGLEVDNALAEYGRLNCEDHDLNNRIIVGNIEHIELDDIGKFDIITCNDVIEHVSNVDLSLKKISSMLNSGGVLNIVVPNGKAISLVESDVHFQLFGITLLEREDAKQYKLELTGIQDNYDHMGEYYNIDYYIDSLIKYGLEVHTQNGNSDYQIDNVNKFTAKLHKKYKNWLANDRHKISTKMAEIFIAQYTRYYDKLMHDYTIAVRSKDTSRFTREYLANYWDIIGTKK